VSAAGGAAADTVVVAASCWLDDAAAAELTADGRRALAPDGPGRRVLHLPAVQVVEADAVRRQAGLEWALGRALAELAACGVDPAFVGRTRAPVRLSVSLCPVDGQAGIVLAADMLAPWVALGADVFLEAL